MFPLVWKAICLSLVFAVFYKHDAESDSLSNLLIPGPHYPLDPERISPQEVSAVMADVLHSHRFMKPPLFEPFLPFMNGVLSSTLRKSFLPLFQARFSLSWTGGEKGQYNFEIN